MSVSIYNQSRGVDLEPARPRIDSQQRHGKFLSYALLCYGYYVVLKMFYRLEFTFYMLQSQIVDVVVVVYSIEPIQHWR